MHIGIVSHVSTAHLSDYLYLKGNEPIGTSGATAPNLIILELLKRGYKVSVFALTNDLADDTEFTVNGKNLTIYYGAYRKRARYLVLDLFKKERKFLEKKILEIKPDILHAHWQYEYSWGALDSGLPTIVTCRDSPVKILMLYKNFYRFIRLIMAYIVLKKATWITATSGYMVNELRQFGVKKQITVIPNFEPDWLFELPAQTTKELEKPLVIMINNGFENGKNVGVGIRAFQLFRQKYPAAELHLYGKGFEEEGKASEWVTKQKLSENVHYKGYVDFTNLMKLLSRYTMMVHPSLEESFGNTLIESMASGVPVVGGKKSGAVPWVIGAEQKGGLLADINDPFSIVTAMETIVSDQATYQRFVESARMEAKNRFSSKKVMDDYIKLYMNALS